jgi:Zn finger protein HypA/HybF involved in hydrogenase expression
VNVLSVASKLGEGKLRSFRGSHGRRSVARPLGSSVALSATAERSRAKRLGGHAEDTAVYNCECGMVFEAAVSTAVSCPHCGGHQAW